MGRRVLRRSVVPLLVTLAGLSSLIFLVACSEPRETPRHEVLAAGVTATPIAEPSSATPSLAPNLSPPPPASTPPLLPTIAPLQQPPAPLPMAPSAPGVEAAAPASEPVDAPPPGPAEAVVFEPVVVPTAAAVEAPAPAPPAAKASAAVVDRVMQLINAARRNAGLEPLSPTVALMETAQRQARAIAEVGSLSHTPPNGSPVASRVQAAGYDGWIALAEVLAAGPASPEGVVALWLSSPEHRAHLLNPALTELGVGYYYLGGSAYGHWWAVDLGSR